MAAGVFEIDENKMSKHPMNMFMQDEIKAKNPRKSNFISTALTLIETGLFFCVLYCNPIHPTCRDDTTLNLISLAISTTNIVGLFNTKQEIKIPLTLGRKEKEGGKIEAFQELNQ